MSALTIVQSTREKAALIDFLKNFSRRRIGMYSPTPSEIAESCSLNYGLNIQGNDVICVAKELGLEIKRGKVGISGKEVREKRGKQDFHVDAYCIHGFLPASLRWDPSSGSFTHQGSCKRCGPELILPTREEIETAKSWLRQYDEAVQPKSGALIAGALELNNYALTLHQATGAFRIYKTRFLAVVDGE